MQLVNTRTGYGWVAILLHWSSAIGVIWLYFLGENIEHARELELTREARRAIIDYHVSVGMVFFFLLGARVIWHVSQVQPEKLRQHVWLNRLARAVIWAFLAMITVQIVSGPVIEWSALRPLKIFNLVSIPSPFSSRSDWLHDGAEVVHKFAPNLFWPLIVLHVAGAARHLFLDPGRSALRMFRVQEVECVEAGEVDKQPS